MVFGSSRGKNPQNQEFPVFWKVTDSPLPSEAGSSISNISTALTDLEAKILTELPQKLEAAFKGEHIARADRLQAKVAQLEEQLSQKSREEAAASSA